MKMLRIAAGLALSACFVMFAGCANAPTIQQQFQTGCTLVNSELTILSTSPVLNAGQQSAVAGILTANQSICKAGVGVTSLREFHDSLLPTAIAVVRSVPPSPEQQAALLGLMTFGPLVQAMVDQVIVTVAPSPASTSAPATAPVAASSPQ